MNKDWGNQFEKYVRHRLKKCHPSLEVDSGTTRIRPSKSPDIKECLQNIRKAKIEIDVIAQSARKVYLISCKTQDQFVGPELVSTVHFLRYDDFYGRVEWDIKKLEKSLTMQIA